MSPLHFTLSIDGLEDESLVVRSFEGQENFSDEPFQGAACFGFRYQIELASRQANLSPEQVVDLQAELRIYRNGECVQRVHGIVRAFTRGDTGHHHTYYSLTLVPALERLSLRHNSRIFQQKNTMEIVTTLLEEMGIEEFAFALRRKNLHTREFCVQYRETDLAFLNRLAAEEGWVYSFEHHEGKHTLLFSDHYTKPLPDFLQLEESRPKDPTTAAHDKQSGRHPRYWRDMSDEEYKKVTDELIRNQSHWSGMPINIFQSSPQSTT